MKTTLLATLFVLALALPSSAQNLVYNPPLTVNEIVVWDLVGSMKITPPGDALLFQMQLFRQTVMIGRVHPTKHGMGGSIPGPGLCLEPPNIYFDFIPDRITVADLNNDGRDDVVATATLGRIQVFTSVAFAACQ